MRISAVEYIHIREVGLGSICFVGDCVELKPSGKALAVQRQISVYSGNEGSFSAFPIFSRPIPLPSPNVGVDTRFTNVDPFINVRHVDIISLSSSAILQVGSNDRIRADNRVKHIRQLQFRPGTSG
ncbi:spore germination protein GerPE [Paenibacillus sp. GYB003]|uniref:spore germination protein GerPE n=1 Tax=Paenibacillus sp. GYB003 TaxID=2994392 RepID=UPI002F964362